MSIRATVKRGSPYGQGTSGTIYPGPECYPNSNTPTSYTLSNFQEELHYRWDVQIPALPQLNMSLFSWDQALAYANRTVQKLRTIGGEA